MTPEDDLLREAFERVERMASDAEQAAANYARATPATFDKTVKAYRDDAEALRAVLALAPAAHQPAAPAWGAKTLYLWRDGDHWLAFDTPYPTYPNGDPRVLGEPEFVVEGRCALPPPAPGLDPEAVARVRSILRDVILVSAAVYTEEQRERLIDRTIIAMAPPADASQSAEVERAEWRADMENAPRDGTPILIWWPLKGFRGVVARWPLGGSGFEVCWTAMPAAPVGQVTHWQPLAAPPAGEN